jgi:putative SOS response-associated peptidase YedK
MPVILDSPDFDLWLNPGMKNVAEVLELLKPYDAHPMRCYPLSHRVNNVINDDEACSEQLNPAIVQDRLFS